MVFHDADSRKNAKGFPDLVLVGRACDGVAFVELKSQFGTMEREQTIWRYRIQATGHRHEIWRPSDLESGHIETVLTNL